MIPGMIKNLIDFLITIFEPDLLYTKYVIGETSGEDYYAKEIIPGPYFIEREVIKIFLQEAHVIG